MSVIPNYQHILTEALQIVNTSLSTGFSIGAQPLTGPKEPVNLYRDYGNSTIRPIGSVHLVKLPEIDNWDSVPYENLARTIEEVSVAILARNDLFSQAEQRKLYTTDNGTLFDFKDIHVTIGENKTFSVENRAFTTFNGKLLSLNQFRSEGIIRFTKQDSGDIELADGIDKRKKKGMFIDSDGKMYRA